MVNKMKNMKMSDDEKLMLFLIWCIGERGLSIDFHDGFGDKEINLWITSHGAFLQFLSEAHEVKESYEWVVSDRVLGALRGSDRDIHIDAFKTKDDFFKNKITITIN